MLSPARSAGRLLGAAAAIFQPSGQYWLQEGQQVIDASVTRARETLDPAAFEAGWSEGHALTDEEALAEAFEESTG